MQRSAKTAQRKTPSTPESAKLFSRAWAVPDGTRNSEKSVCHNKHAPRKVDEMMEMMMMMMLKVTRCVTLVRGGSGWKLVVYSWMWLMKVVMVVVVMVVMVVVVVVGGCGGVDDNGGGCGGIDDGGGV
jgi:hypothetical protein